ncbi:MULTISPECIES: AAA family ATPase [Variovorax]|jgi:energy-coupling factor transporter ATP-binding protein EcfA2|uniref:AAA family ATPase n=1 Tax=Variovorax TaxID=34072 RepID=UPI00086EAD5F|nr:MULTISPECIES: AAA family ATPase [Variovorax]ODU16079.1 MAG: hypothetical protein ABS94_16355 [Variovorax sp. SCN 67-85]ODV22329.1 MAG: hypothetical protein ABT25_21535 [Variovorax sp. SCN 67-20]OJZ14279.1 MAG: hypothetical protein BGP22_06200 [Variovorax sp. 67-131]UKI08818.1 AAA family ATPase [Variovorax paradoxus]
MTSSDSMRFTFPRISRVQLHAFSLYSLEPNAALQIKPGVTCMAGANGIGKSTFLSTINYALTGVVPHPKRHFLSAMAYQKEAADFTKDFFDGRIIESDRDSAAVSVEFSIADKDYVIKRGLFEASALQKCHISHQGKVLFDSEMHEAAHADAHYREAMCRDIGLSSFEQFVMVQHFLLTFDESRHLVFWDKEVSAALLYLCFGGDPKEAAMADTLNREMEKAGSRGRNFQYQANNLAKRIEILEQSLAPQGGTEPEVERARAHYEALHDAAKEALVNSEEVDARLSDAELKVMQASASVAGLRAAYGEIFERFVNGTANARQHPLVQLALADCKCPVCSASDSQVAPRIEAKLLSEHCPLCDAALTRTSGVDAGVQAELEDVDKKLAVGRRQLEEAVAILDRHKRAATAAKQKVASTYESIATFEELNRQAIDGFKVLAATQDGAVAENLKAIQAARRDQLAERDHEYLQRDKYRDELRGLQRELAKRYSFVEQEFVPRFKQLAETFLGIDLNISLVIGQATGLHLELEMRGNSRRQQHQLSESQRFFVDIALRMALAQHISAPSGEATLFVDTPEGSLDIAYEDRAGKMFADFVRSGHDLIMTANINSSKLLRTLASTCHAERMEIVQMTGWTELSDVQENASGLFREAYADIQSALNSTTAAS